MSTESSRGWAAAAALSVSSIKASRSILELRGCGRQMWVQRVLNVWSSHSTCRAVVHNSPPRTEDLKRWHRVRPRLSPSKPIVRARGLHPPIYGTGSIRLTSTTASCFMILAQLNRTGVFSQPGSQAALQRATGGPASTPPRSCHLPLAVLTRPCGAASRVT